MKSNELRVGNLAQDQNGNLLKCLEISPTNVCWQVVDRSKYPLPAGWQAEPIPLTEEWLEKLGFERPEFTSGLYRKGILNIVVGTNGVWRDTFIKKNNAFIMIHEKEGNLEGDKYLHELENLYFSLTGKELLQ